MKNRIIALVMGMVLLLFSSLFAVITFERWYGGDKSDLSRSVIQTNSGGYLITGSTTSFGAGFWDVYLINVDSIGDTLWSKTYGGIYADGGRSAAKTFDAGYIIAGSTNSFGSGFDDIFLLKTDSLGDTSWTKTYGDSSQEFSRSVMQISNNEYVIAGNKDDDIYAIETDSLGNVNWENIYGDTSGIDECFSMSRASDSGYVLAGWTNSYGAGMFDAHLVKIDKNGDSLWAKTYGNARNDAFYASYSTSDGGFILTGSTDIGVYDYDLYLVKTDSIGNVQWAKTFGDTGAEFGHSVIQSSDGGYVIAGNKSLLFGSRTDVYLMKTDSLGNLKWARTFGDTFFDNGGHSVIQASDGGYIIAGYTAFGSSGDSWEVYLIKTDSLGNVTGVQEQPDQINVGRDQKIIIAPNPFTIVTNIQLLGACENTKSDLHIYDSAGRLVKSVTLATSTYELGVDLVPGIYFLKLNGKPVGKVVKVR